MSDPVTLGIGGAVIGGMLDKENPLRGATIGGLGGAIGGPMFNAAAEAAPGMAGAAGSGITGSLGSAAGQGGMSALGGLGSGVGSTAGGLSPMGLAGGASGIAPMGGGMAALGAEGAGLAGGVSPQLAALGGAGAGASGGLLGNPMADKALSMGGQMMMKNQQAQQGQPVMPGIAPPMMRPGFGAPSFMASAPSFRPAIGGMPMNNPVAANPRFRG